jgi:hypothetical protein
MCMCVCVCVSIELQASQRDKEEEKVIMVSSSLFITAGRMTGTDGDEDLRDAMGKFMRRQAFDLGLLLMVFVQTTAS